MRRSRPTLVLVAALVAALTAPASAQLPVPAPDEQPATGGAEAPPGRVVHPTDELTVADAAQATGRRVALPLPDCERFASDCADIRLVNDLDGFDVLPRVAVQLDDAPDGALDEVFVTDVLHVRAQAGGDPIGLVRLVYDPVTGVLTGEPAEQLVEGTRYEVVYRGEATPFTTMTATAGLVPLRRQLDDGSAYDAAGIAEDARTITFVQSVAGSDGDSPTELRTVFDASQVVTIRRYDEVVPGGALRSAVVPNAAVLRAGTYAFGSFLSPSWLREDRTITPTPTGGAGAGPVGAERVGVTLIVPEGTPPEGGWPVAVFGPGITRSKYDLFLAADLNAVRGIATMSFDPAGHAFGPRSEVGVQPTNAPAEVRFLGFGRGVDLDDDGTITDREGVQAPRPPHPSASVGLRDGLRQTALDLMALVRAIRRGVDVDGDGATDLSTTEVDVYAQSLGGIYGTMAVAADPLLDVAVLNVPGGSILDIAVLAPGFRPAVAEQLRNRIPGRLNGGPNGFDEDLPLRAEPPVDDPAPGATAIQDIAARVNWLNRPGSPEAYAPLLALRPLPDAPPKQVLYQFAFGDQTVPNPTSARLARAFGVPERVALYRNDRTVTASRNPHGFLLDPTVQGREQAQAQVVEFLASDGAMVVDPDGPLPTWEVPIPSIDVLEQRNFGADLYADPSDAPRRLVERLAGDDRVATAVAVSGATYAEAASVVIARADAYPDALAGGPLAAVEAGPLLLSASDALSAATAEEIERLGAERAILLGGDAALSGQVAADLAALGLEVERVGGASRFETAALVAERMGYTAEVLVAEGANADPARGWPDALSASAIGSALRIPILLVTRDALPPETAEALSATQDVTVVGGPAAVGDAVVAALNALVDDVDRVLGGDRYGTSSAAATEGLLRGLSPTTTWIATGRDFADGLVAGAAAGAVGGSLLLVDGEDLDGSPAAAAWLRDHGASIDVARLSGGAVAVSAGVEDAVGAAVRAG